MMKKFTAIMLMAVMFCQSTGCFVFARGVVNNGREIHMSLDNLKPQDKEFLAKLQQMFGEFKLEDNKLALKSSYAELQDKYKLTEYDLSMMKNILNLNSTQQKPESENMYIEDWKVYLNTDEVSFYLATAASMGPIALMTAMDAVIVLIGGPLGGPLAAILDAMGAISFGGFCYLISQAVINRQGVYFGVD